MKNPATTRSWTVFVIGIALFFVAEAYWMRYGGPEWWFMNGRGSDEFLAAQKASLVRDIIDGVGAAACMVSPFLSSATFWRCILLSVLAGAVAIFTIWALALIVIFSFYGF